MKPNAVILLSGGLDSTTCLAIAKNQGYQCNTITINYGQRHDFELQSAQKIIEAFQVRNHNQIDIDLAQFGGSALTGQIPIPKDRDESEMKDIPTTYVPARNTVFLSLALARAETIGAFNIFIGVNALDYSGYPDCRPEYIQAFENMSNLATKSSVSGHKFKIHTPLIQMTKAEIILTGLDLGIDYSMTSSCYDPEKNGNPCGHCDACFLRLKGFREAEQVDPLLYPVE